MQLLFPSAVLYAALQTPSLQKNIMQGELKRKTREVLNAAEPDGCLLDVWQCCHGLSCSFQNALPF